MEHLINEIASKVWLVMTEVEEISLSELSQKIELEEEDIILAVGWLAKEDKIMVERIEGNIILFNYEAHKFSFG